MAMVTVTKKHLHFQINWDSVYKGLFSVKLVWNRNLIPYIESERWNQNTNRINDSKYLKQNNPNSTHKYITDNKWYIIDNLL